VALPDAIPLYRRERDRLMGPARPARRRPQ